MTELSVLGTQDVRSRSSGLDDGISTLVVDDSQAMLNEMCRYVEALPSLDLVGTAMNGQQAIERFASLRPRLILMDFQMPGMNGLQAATEIKSQMQDDTKIIMVTIHDNARLREAVLASGVDGFLSKAQLRKELPKELGRLFPADAS